MTVKINLNDHLSNDSCPEKDGSILIKSYLSEYFSKIPSANGTINIYYSLTLNGQNVRDIDIAVIGKLDNVIIKKSVTDPVTLLKRDLQAESFCFVIELKQHPYNKIRKNGSHVYVEYKDEIKDVTDQSEKQKYAFANYFQNKFNYNILVNNIIWLQGINDNQLKDLEDGNNLGCLPCDFSFPDLIHIWECQINKQKVLPFKGLYHMNAPFGQGLHAPFLSDIEKLLNTDIKPQGLTRRKMELLTQEKISRSISISEGMTIFSGRAGTGKTVYLLQTGLYLISEKGSRCLILTYNHALVSDIRRLLHFMNIPDDVDCETMQIQTLHQFFVRIFNILGINFNTNENFDKEYTKCIKELNSYIENQLNQTDIDFLKEDKELGIDWDYILVDEAQDWSEEEKNILLNIYGPQRIIIADGKDQFIRGNKHLTWNKGLSKVNKQEKTLGLRQKMNLITFVNSYAEHCKLNWKVTPNSKLPGGQIFIMENKDYTDNIHNRIQQYIKKNDCENYDILFLVPPCLVEKSTDGKDRHFKKLKKFNDSNIFLFDGTSLKNRDCYPVNTNESRLFQYESCRGLEAWCTICMSFDKLIEHKINIYKGTPENDLSLESEEERKKRNSYLWSLMPLSRPIDTLIILLDDPQSEVGLILKDIAQQYPDFIDYMSTSFKNL